jgi:hypothetical protein
MSLRPPGRDNSDPLAACRVAEVEDYTLAHAKQIAALFTIGLALVDPLDGESMANGSPNALTALSKVMPVVAPVLGRLVVIPLELFVLHIIRDTSILLVVQRAGFSG